MNIEKMKHNGVEIAFVNGSEVLITDVQSALDLMATVSYEAGAHRIILDKAAICEDFFDLKTKLAGDILQKYTNYQTKLAIIGDFSQYESKSLKDFIYESNQGKSVFFLSNKEQAIEKLSMA